MDTVTGFYLSSFAFKVGKDLVLDPVSVLRVIFVGIRVKHQTTNVMQIVDIFVQIRHIVSYVLDRGVQLLELVLVHLDDGYKYIKCTRG